VCAGAFVANDSESFRYIPRSGIAGSHGRSIFSFLRTLILFSLVVVLAYIPPAAYEGSFSASSPTFVVVCVLDDNHSNRSKIES
jgi:hypothetical protein